MQKKLAIAILSILFTVALPTPSWAETVIEKVVRTGVLTAGTRKDARPFGYINEDEEWVGYSLDMLALIREQLEKELGKKITLELVEVEVANRIPRVVERKVDLVCGSTSFTWEREKAVDFSIPYFLTGTQLLVKKGSSLGSVESLKGKRIGAIPETTNEQLIKRLQPQAILVPVKNRAEGFSALEQDQIDAFAWDGILLEGLRQIIPNPDDFAVVPEEPYDRAPYACMVPEDNSKFRELVNYSIAKFMQGFILNDRKYVTLFDRWFGSTGLIPLNRDQVLFHFRNILDYTEQIPKSDL